MTTGSEKSLLMVTTVPVTLRGFLLPIARRMRAQGWRVDAAARGVSAEPDLADEFDHLWEVDWSRNPLQPSNLLRAVRQIRAAVEQGGHRVVHVHTPVAAFITRLALRRMRAAGEVKVVYTAHGFHFHERGSVLGNSVFLALEKLAGRWTDRLVLINRQDLESALSRRLVRPERVVHMHGIGIDAQQFRPRALDGHARRETRERLGVRDDETLLLVPAEFTANKRQAAIVEALGYTERPDIHVAFAGTGPLLATVEESARRQGLAENTHFLGWRADVPELMAAADGVVLFSEREGLSRSVMEALALERPVIGSDIRGIRDLLCDGCGILVDPDRTDLLAEAFLLLASDPEWGAHLGRAGRSRIEGPYEQSAILARHEWLYEEVLSHA